MTLKWETLFGQRDVRETATGTKTISPIGAVLPWLKSFTNTPVLPVGWVECSGQVLSDSESVYDGQTIPDLNGDNRFLRGSSTSGSTGGSENHQHVQTSGKLASGGVAFDNQKFGNGVGGDVSLVMDYETNDSLASGGFTGDLTSEARESGGTATSPLPTYYEVTWIMRVK